MSVSYVVKGEINTDQFEYGLDHISTTQNVSVVLPEEVNLDYYNEALSTIVNNPNRVNWAGEITVSDFTYTEGVGFSLTLVLNGNYSIGAEPLATFALYFLAPPAELETPTYSWSES